MSVGVSIISTIVGYIILMIMGVNLIGAIVRGFVQSDIERQIIGENISESKSIGVTVVFILLSAAYLYALYHFWNVGVAIAAIMLMISRIPDLIFEIKTGQKITLRTMPKRPIHTLFNLLGWLALPMLWYSLYYLESRVTF